MNVIEATRQLGKAIQEDEAYKAFAEARAKNDADSELQEKMSRYETERKLLGEEFSKPEGEIDREVVTKLRAAIEELTRQISANENYIAFSEAQRAMNNLMASVNAEIKFAITGERPSECTHDCSTCSGCH